MTDFYRKIDENSEPLSTAEIELRRLLGEQGKEFFDKYFPPEQVEREVESAIQWEEWLRENEPQQFAELAIAEFSQKAKEQIIYLAVAINFFEYCLKAELI